MSAVSAAVRSPSAPPGYATVGFFQPCGSPRKNCARSAPMDWAAATGSVWSTWAPTRCRSALVSSVPVLPAMRATVRPDADRPADGGAVPWRPMSYLDHAATTPILPSVVAAVTAAMGEVGNASSLHGSGRAARRRVEESRESIADALGARPSEVLFTSGGTESDNLAVAGIFRARRAADPRRRR